METAVPLGLIIAGLVGLAVLVPPAVGTLVAAGTAGLGLAVLAAVLVITHLDLD